ncbi:MAG: addiction module toxin RelE [Alphaproteobacteria bacterium]|nr:MAG: addiction module toxin RelE [Alphaproteobacteria bacterium]
MSVYQTKEFARFARKERMSAKALLQAVADVAQGQFDADLGGSVFKQRVARSGAGKSGGFRTILFFKAGRHTFFAYGFAKSERANVSAKELKALKKLADELLGYSAAKIAAAETAGELIELVDEDDGEEEDDDA